MTGPNGDTCWLIGSLSILLSGGCGADATAPPTNSPSDLCADWLACLGATADGELAEAEGRYGEGGSCWREDPSGEGCDEACVAGLLASIDAHPETPECSSEGLPNMNLLFTEWTRWSLDWVGGAPLPWDFDWAAVLGDPVSGDLLLYFELGRDEGWYVDEWCYEDVYRSYSWYALCTMSGLAFTCRYTDTSDSLSEFEDVVVTGEFAADFNSGALLFTPCPYSDDEPCTLAGEIQR